MGPVAFVVIYTSRPNSKQLQVSSNDCWSGAREEVYVQNFFFQKLAGMG